jgi:glycosyltransferase involved in cell wall biosynthesis
MKLLQISGREAGGQRGARDFAARVQATLGGALLELAGLPRGESALAAVKRALEDAPEVVLVHLGLASPETLMLLRERGVRFAVFLHDYSPLCPTQRLWHRRGERCSGPGRTGWKCAWCAGGGRAASALELPVRALLYRHRPQAWRTALAGAEAMIVPSRFARERWIEEGAPPERLAVIAPAPGAQAAVARPAAPGRRVVFAGGTDEAEGGELLAAALEQLRRPVQLEIMGGLARPPFDEAETFWREALAAPHELRVSPGGVWPDLDAASVVAVPTRRETPFSTAIAAAQAAGARAAATAMGGAAEQIVHGVNGFLATPEDPGALAESLEEAFSAAWNPGLVAARAAAEAERSLAAMRQLLEAIANGATAPALLLEHGAWLERRAAARGETLEEGVRQLGAELRRMPVVEDQELSTRARQTSRQHRLGLNHALAYLEACDCRRVAVLPLGAVGEEEARQLLEAWGIEAVAETELPDGVLQLSGEEDVNPDRVRGWVRRRFPQLKAYAGISPEGTETFGAAVDGRD